MEAGPAADPLLGLNKTAIAQYYHTQGMTTKDIAQKMGVSYQQVYQAVKKMKAIPAPVDKKGFQAAVDAQQPAYQSLADVITPAKTAAAQEGWKASRDLLGITCKGVPKGSPALSDEAMVELKDSFIHGWTGSSTSGEVATVMSVFNKQFGYDATSGFTKNIIARLESLEKSDKVRAQRVKSFAEQFLTSSLRQENVTDWDKLSKKPLYRGVTNAEQAALQEAGLGDVVTLRSLISTSDSDKIAQGFSSRANKILLRFNNVPGSHVFASTRLESDKYGFEAMSAERETILFGNITPWRIVKKSKGVGVTIIDLEPVLEKVHEAFREAGLDPVETSLCGPVPTHVLQALKSQSLDLSFMVMADERAALTGVLGAAAESGWTRKQVSEVLQQVFKEGFHQIDKVTGKVVSRKTTEAWARTVARTEMCRASSAGEMAMYEMADVKRLEWSASEGMNMCPTCGIADGEVVGRGQEFPVVDVSMPPAHPNCQCAILPSDEDLVTKRSSPHDIAWSARGGRSAAEYEQAFGVRHAIDRTPPGRYNGVTPL